MTNVDLMKEFLSSQGFKYEQYEDNDIFFKYQMRNFIFMGSDNDETFLRLVMPGVFDVTEDNRAGVLEATNAVSVSMKVVKATIVNDNVWLSAELLIDSTPVFDDIIPRVLDILLAAQQEFYKQIN